MPVDLYIGGVEHAILHLIYARFFTKVLRDLGLTSVDEPFPHYLAQGMVTKDGSAMSKSRGNTVDPDGIISSHGADALRLFILFASPPDKEFAWSTDGLEGCGRFLNRLWVFFRENLDVFAAGGAEAAAAPPEVRRKTHQTIRRVSEDIGVRFHLNTAISGIMEFYNFLKRERDALRQTPAGRAGLREALEALILLLAPFAPHLAEELREAVGKTELLARSTWPSYDPELARDETVTIVVQVGGRLRDRFETAAGTAEAELEAAALGLERIRAVLGGKPPRKVICVKDKLVNIVP
jgi:leucyl-tRNA synthetase